MRRSIDSDLLERLGLLILAVSSLISDFPKDISVPTHPKSDLELFASHPTRGAFRERHGRGEGCGGRGSVLRAMDGRAGWRKACERSTASGREMLQRTAKSRGPDAPTLASSSRSRVGPTGLRQDLIRR